MFKVSRCVHFLFIKSTSMPCSFTANNNNYNEERVLKKVLPAQTQSLRVAHNLWSEWFIHYYSLRKQDVNSSNLNDNK